MRIGLVLNVLNEEYQISVYKGVKEQADKLGIELVCFQLEGVPFDHKTFANQFPSSAIFNIEGIILVTSSVTDSYRLKTKKQIESLWPRIPVISLGQRIFDIPSILMQTNSSMKVLVEHLIRVHKYRNFLFIRGPEFHEDANERRTIFELTIGMYKSFFPQLRYTEKAGNFNEVDGTNAIAQYYSENKSLPDVVVSSNDNMAIGVYKFLQMNEFKEKQCAVTGFDDIPQSEFMVPSLSTVHQPLRESGNKAVDLLESLVLGNKPVMETYVLSDIVLRESCGCCLKQKQSLTSDEKVREIQKNSIQSERLLKILGYMGQELIFCDGYDVLRTVLNNYCNQLDLNEYYVFSFQENIQPESSLSVDSVQIIPVFLKKDGCDFSDLYKKSIYSLNDFMQILTRDYGFSMKNKLIKYLNNSSQLIGFVLYESDQERLPFLCSMSVILSQTLISIKNIEQEKKRSEYLEKEVTKRTAQLVKANDERLKVEAEVLKISEIERHRFSLDLHDDICQRLAGISMLCRSYSNIDEGITKDKMVELAELINDTLQRTRQYAHNSYPVELESLGLDGSLNNLCNSFCHQNSLECDYTWEVDQNLCFENIQKLNIFRIIQEALHNISKHACASKVWVKITNKNKKILVSICDDGKGFKKDSLKKKGLGLTSMEYRANQIGGELKIGNNEPSGARIDFTFQVS